MADVDLQKVEAIREKMLLSVDTFTTMARVNRVTYYTWVRGTRVPRTAAKQKLHEALAKLAAIIRDHQWPNESVRAMGVRERQEYFLALAARY